MAELRESVFVPTVKCSTCALEVDISKMGDHICGRGAAQELGEPQMNNASSADGPFLSPSVYQERAPPSVDTAVANRQNMRLEQFTPVSSSSESQYMSPRTPNRGSPPGQMGNYFPAEIASDDVRTLPMSQVQPPYGGHERYDEPESYTGAMSPIKQLGNEQYQPYNEQYQSYNEPYQSYNEQYQSYNAPAPASFDSYQKPLPAINDFKPRQDSLESSRYWTEPSPSTNQPPMTDPRFSNTAREEDSYGLRTDPYRNYNTVERNGGFGELKSPAAYTSRSETYSQINSPIKSPTRKMSAPVTANYHRQSGSTDDGRRPTMGPVTTRAPPPRTNLVRITTAAHLAKSSVDLAAEFGIENPYTASESGSSGYSSSSSRNSQMTAQTSPTLSHPSRKPSQNYSSDDIEELQASMENMRPTDLRVDTTAPPIQQHPSLFMRSPRSLSMGGDYGDIPRSAARDYNAPSQEYPQSANFGPSPKLITDFSASSVPRHFRNESLPAHMQFEASPISPLSPGSLPRKDRGDCKSCRLPIKGKSISSADGRLTGKYHKACFVCTTCFEPFTSAEFYVLDDKPFCSRHYHKLNGSLCGSCSRGIEGQYLEDEAKIKYHPRCFRCLDCGISLSDGYFEVDGKSYCERHAWRRVQHALNRQPSRTEAEPEVRSRPQPPPKGPPAPRPPRALGGLPSNPKAGVSKPVPGQPDIGRSHPSIVLMGLEPPRLPQMNKRNTRLGMI